MQETDKQSEHTSNRAEITRELRVQNPVFPPFGVIDTLPGTVMPQANIPGRENFCQTATWENILRRFDIERGDLYTSDQTAPLKQVQVICCTTKR